MYIHIYRDNVVRMSRGGSGLQAAGGGLYAGEREPAAVRLRPYSWLYA